MPPQDRAALAAYARGVNAYLDSHRGRLPLEFTLLGYDPRPWSVVDSILIGLHMFRNLTTTYPDEILKQKMLAGGDPAKVDFLFPVRTGHEAPPGAAPAGRRRTAARARTPGPLPARTRRRENRWSRTICIWNSRFPGSGTWCICNVPA